MKNNYDYYDLRMCYEKYIILNEKKTFLLFKCEMLIV